MNKTLLTSTFILFILLSDVPRAAALSSDQNATGLREPTPEESQWIASNFPVVQGIKLNSIALERINQDRVKRGLGKLSERELDIAPLGSELSFESSQLTGATATTTLPSWVDNSASNAFPPIRSQGGIGSCVAWATTYYQFSYENNLALGRNAVGVDGKGDNAYIFSPKWTYNMINGGVDAGSYFSAAYNLELKNGAVTWAAFPYDSNYLQWCMNTQAWRDAINYRATSWGRISNTNIDNLIADVKTQLANGHVIVIGTYVNSWVSTRVLNDPSTAEDDACVNQYIASYMRNTAQGGHGMTLVGYNDALWCDLNGNGAVDTGEKGAFKIANSWGTGDWNAGYRWVTYDSLRGTSAVPSYGSWPTNDRASAGIFRGSDIYTLTVAAPYQPKIVAEFTLNQLSRSQLTVTLGIGDLGSTTPSTTWTSGALTYSGGNYAFDGTKVACDGTFILDFSDLTPTTAMDKRWFLSITDSATDNPTTIKGYKIYESTASGDTLVGTSPDTPRTVDGSNTALWIDYRYNSLNESPTASATATPTSGNIPLPVSFDGSASTDPDGRIVSYAWSFGDGSIGTGSQTTHTYTVGGSYTATLTVTDDKGARSTTPIAIEAIDPNKVNTPTNLVAKAGRGSLTLTWTDNSNNEEGFIIEMATKAKAGYSFYTEFKRVGPNTSSWSGSIASGSYKFRVRAYKETTYSGYSNEAPVRVR